MPPAFVVFAGRNPPRDAQDVGSHPLCLVMVVRGKCTHRTYIRLPSSPYTRLALRICKTPSVTRRQIAGVLDPTLD